ncbi:MAG: DUF3316 domain-containing protein [Tannerella sp.]|jgi:hypothetical protein|nr:DUF3316 domain-containing protein [Tannerella sp.]
MSFPIRKLLRCLGCFLIIITFPYGSLLQAQDETGRAQNLRVLQEATSIGAGFSQVKDTYLSPFDYTGWGLRILDERLTLRYSKHFSVQQILSADISSTENPAENVNDFGAFVDYFRAYPYRFIDGPAFKLLGGPFAHLLGGFLYNTRNGNNPLSAKVDLDLGASLLLFYTFRLGRLPLTLRYQADLPVGGIFFAPPYGASYYEMFNEGNVSDIVSLNSFHNKFALKNTLTLDIPIRHAALRIGILSSYYRTNAKELQTRIFSNTFTIGWVKEFYIK